MLKSGGGEDVLQAYVTRLQSGSICRQVDNTTKLQNEENVPGRRNARYLREGGGGYRQQ
jgi:hypothetical protein